MGEAPCVNAFGEGVIGRENDVYVNSALWCVTIVLEFQTMVMMRVYVVGIIAGCDNEWNQAEGGPF